MTDNNSDETIDTDLEEPLLPREEQQQGAATADAATEEKLPSISRLISLGKPEFCILALAGVFMMVSQISSLYIPLLVGRAYDDLVDKDIPTHDKMKHINGLMFWAVVIHVSGALASGFRSTLMGIAGERIVARMRTTLYASMLKQEIAFFDATKSGELVSRLGSDTMIVKQAIATSWAEVSLGFIRLVATLALMFHLSPKLAGLTIGSTLTVFLVCLPFGRTLGKLSKYYQEILGEAQNLPTEVIGAMRTVKSFGAETREADRYESIIGKPRWCCDMKEKSTFRVGCTQSLVRAGFSFCIFGGGFGAMYATLWYGFLLVSKDELRIGDLSAFQAYILGIGGMLAHMSGSISNLISARHASQRIFGLLDRKPKITDGCCGGSADNNNASGGGSRDKEDDDDDDKNNNKNNNAKIAFSKVSFSYPTRPDTIVLRDFSLTIPKNKTTAIVGPSGAGKSTIISLLERFYDVQKGSILFDGVDVRQMTLKGLRKHLGYVQQEPTLFGMSVRDNLVYGLETDLASSITDDELLEACKTANAYDFVLRLPNGLDEMVGERGVTLSGGQKQRLAIARAILGEPSVLLLDEATSALDAESEFLVQKAMDAASKGRTVVVVAHRLSTIKKADQIVVLEDHTLNDVGTHEELLKRCPTYQNLFSKQSFVVAAAATENKNNDAATTSTSTTTSQRALSSPAKTKVQKTPKRTPDRRKRSDSPTKIPKTPKRTPKRTPDRQKRSDNPPTITSPPTVPRRTRVVDTGGSGNTDNDGGNDSSSSNNNNNPSTTTDQVVESNDDQAQEQRQEQLRMWKQANRNNNDKNVFAGESSKPTEE